MGDRTVCFGVRFFYSVYKVLYVRTIIGPLFRAYLLRFGLSSGGKLIPRNPGDSGRVAGSRVADYLLSKPGGRSLKVGMSSPCSFPNSGFLRRRHLPVPGTVF
uniref:Uncharacterized protein n=1 Tax=Ascaris lumbricoides TaxID=6252 RepID=A0A0M3ICE8_ASCLU